MGFWRRLGGKREVHELHDFDRLVRILNGLEVNPSWFGGVIRFSDLSTLHR